MHTVLVSDRKPFGDLLADGPLADAEVRRERCTDEERLRETAADADALVVDANTPVTAAVLRDLDLAVVARSGTGVDNVDVAAAREVGTVVTNVPDYSAEEVSSHAVALLLSLARGLGRYDRSVRDGEWDWTAARPLHRLSERTLGIVAVGTIGAGVARKAAPLFDTVVGYDPGLSDAELRERGVEPVGFPELLARAHAVSIHAPLTEATRGLFDRETFESMREGSLLVNVGRGGVVDEAALLSALESGAIAGAGLDVFAEEPPTDRRLVDHERTLVTPHAGFYSEESVEEACRRALQSVATVFDGGTPADVVEPGGG